MLVLPRHAWHGMASHRWVAGKGSSALPWRRVRASSPSTASMRTRWVQICTALRGGVLCHAVPCLVVVDDSPADETQMSEVQVWGRYRYGSNIGVGQVQVWGRYRCGASDGEV